MCRLCDQARRLERSLQDATAIYACASVPANFWALPYTTQARAPLMPGQVRAVEPFRAGLLVLTDPPPRFQAAVAAVATWWAYVDEPGQRVLCTVATVPHAYAPDPGMPPLGTKACPADWLERARAGA